MAADHSKVGGVTCDVQPNKALHAELGFPPTAVRWEGSIHIPACDAQAN